MKLLCFTSAKGGVGTSFILACTAFAFAKLGKKCLVADMCAGGRALDLYMGTDGGFVFDMQDVISGSCEFEDAVIKSGEGVDFISCSDNLEYIDYQSATDMLIKYGDRYDYILADCPSEYAVSQAFGGLGTLMIVTACDKASVRCTEKLVYDTTDECEKYLIINNIIPELIQNAYHINVDDICDLCGVSPIGLIPYEPLAVTGDAVMICGTDTLNICRGIANMTRRLEGESVNAISFRGKTNFCKLMKKYSRSIPVK